MCAYYSGGIRRRLLSDWDHIWHTHAYSSIKGSGPNTNYHCVTHGGFGGFQWVRNYHCSCTLHHLHCTILCSAGFLFNNNNKTGRNGSCLTWLATS